MHKLTFSIGLILLIAFSVFSPIQILKIESVNAQVTVPKNYIQTVNDWDINHTDAWQNFTVGLDPDSYTLINNGSDGCFTGYSKREGCDEWGDAVARQGYFPHESGYCRDWNNKIIKPMLSYPYIPVDVGNDKIILQMSARHSAPVYYGNWPALWERKSLWPTIGGTIMLYFNVWVHDLWSNEYKWMFNFHEPNPWAGPNMFLLEIFMARWIVPLPWPYTGGFQSCNPGFPAFEVFYPLTTHDNDLHLITCPFDMPQSDQWYYMMYDVGSKIRECEGEIEEWSRFIPGEEPAYDVLGFQLMTIAIGVETIGGSWTFQVGNLSLTDIRWGSGSAYQNSAQWELKTNTTGCQSIPMYRGLTGYPNPLRPYMTYANTSLEADVDGNGFVSGTDIARVSWRFGSSEIPLGGHRPPTRQWDYTCDMNKNGRIDGTDIAFVSYHFGEWGTYETGLGSIKVWMQEEPPYNPDPPPNYDGPPWWVPRWTPYTVNYYMELWDVLVWPSEVTASMSCMANAVFYNGTTLTAMGICLYAFDYPVHY